MSIEELRDWLATRRWTERQRATAGHLLDELGERLDVLHRVGLDYLTLDRQARTLSGGETQRIHLAAALGSGLTSTLYVLDEPTIGLHPQDSERLLELLRDLAARGNTVLVVEHDRTLIRGADHVIDLGPRRRRARRPGDRRGDDRARSCASPDSLTAPLPARAAADRGAPPPRALPARARLRSRSPTSWRRGRALGIRGARENNLRGFDVELPLSRAGGGDRGLRLGQVDPGRERPLRHLPAARAGWSTSSRGRATGSTASTSWSTSPWSTSGRSAARRARTR